jgi:hypothetical protein
MTTHREKRPAPFLDSALLGWASGIVALAGWILLWPHSTPMEIGALGTLVWLGATFTVFYLFDILLFFIAAYYILINVWPRSRPWHWGAIGASLFALSCPLWIAAFGGQFLRDDLVFSVFGAIAGGVSFYELRRRTLVVTTAA